MTHITSRTHLVGTMTGTRASLAPTARTKPRSRDSTTLRIAGRLAVGAVITLNALVAICWPQVVELVASYR